MSDKEEYELHGLTPKNIEDLNKYRQPVALRDKVNYLKAVIYGKMGVGKTTLVARYAKALDMKMLILGNDTGHMVLENHGLEDIAEYVPWIGPNQLKAFSAAIRWGAPGYREFGVICVDTASGITEEYLSWLTENYVLPKRPTATARQGTGLPNMDSRGFDDYNLTKQFMQPVINNLNQARANVFYITHVREPDFMAEDKERTKGIITPTRPDVPDKVFKALGYDAHLMGYMDWIEEAGKVYRRLDFRPSKRFEVKSRIKELHGNRVTDNEFLQIVEAWTRKSGQFDNE